MLSLVFDLSMSLRVDRCFVANASVGANGHVIQGVARATMQALFCLQHDLYRQYEYLRINSEVLLPSILVLAFLVSNRTVSSLFC